MIELLPNLPDNIVGFSASGKVTADDYETVIIPAIEASFSKYQQIRVIYQLGSAFTGFSAGAMWDDMKVGLSHFKRWEKVALVTDHEWIAGTTQFFGLIMPCPVQVFAEKELDQAIQWITS